MKKLLTYLFIVSVGLFLFGCDKPAPTELFDDSQEELAEYEVLGKDINDEFYSNGFDTTGVTQDLNELPNLISLSGIKVTNIHKQTDEFSFAQSIFFDRTKKIFSPGGRFLGFQSITPGIVRFDNKIARIVPLIVRYRENSILQQTILGDKYNLFSGRHGNMDDFHYRHNSLMNFRINIFSGDQVSFDIATPVEITGIVEILGSRNHGDLRALLHWNRGNTPDITIIIGAGVRDRDIIMPLYRIRTRDDGELLVPTRFIKEIPLQNFDGVVFTFIRRFEGTHQDDRGNDLLVSSQSIHSIVVNLN
ncbi:MAG: hypothetical protein O6940_02985 [Ignavibacteria bacterium]|nr:hypothetical protein [Ignavibacteria bacterium]